MTWIILALIAPFFWALSNLLDKYAIDKLSKGTADFIFFGSIGGFIVLLFSLIINGGVAIISPILILTAVLGGALLNYSYIFYAKALESRDATRVVPLFQTIPIFILVLGYLFFNESVSYSQFIGFVIVFSGGLVLTTQMSFIKKFKIDSSFWLMLASSLFISVSMLFSDHVLETERFMTLFIYDLFGYSLAGLSLLLYRPWRREIFTGIKKAKRFKYLLFFANDAIDLAGGIFYKFALITAPSVALASVMLGIQPFYLLVLGVLLTIFFPKIIKEDISKKAVYQKLFGVGIIFIGIILIFLF